MQKALPILYVLVIMAVILILNPSGQEQQEIDKAIDEGTVFLKARIDRGDYYLECESSNREYPCPLHKKGHAPISYFIVTAIGNNLSHLEETKLASRILNQERGGLWSYGGGELVDADDTAFVLHALKKMDMDNKIRRILVFYDESGKGFRTFLTNETTVDLVFKPNETNNKHMHPEVNANVYRLLLGTDFEDYINYELILESQAPEGYWYSYFYPSKYYSTYINLELLCNTNEQYAAKDRGVHFLLNSQNDNGSWGVPGNAYETALALNALLICNISNTGVESGISFLLNSQLENGSWSSTNVVWEYYLEQSPLVIWRAIDRRGVITTSLAIEALHKYQTRMK